MTTMVDLDTGRVLGVVDGRDSTGIGEWLFVRPLEWRLGVEVVAIDPLAGVPQGPAHVATRITVFVDAFPVSLANRALIEARHRLTQERRGRRGRTVDPVWANPRQPLRGAETLDERGPDRSATTFAGDDSTGALKTCGGSRKPCLVAAYFEREAVGSKRRPTMIWGRCRSRSPCLGSSNGSGAPSTRSPSLARVWAEPTWATIRSPFRESAICAAVAPEAVRPRRIHARAHTRAPIGASKVLPQAHLGTLPSRRNVTEWPNLG